LEKLLVLRNAIVHANGRLDTVKKDSRQKIETWQSQNIGIFTDNNYLMFSAAFVEEMLTVVDNTLHDLVERAKTLDHVETGNSTECYESVT
jgi:hypothetical protein